MAVVDGIVSAYGREAAANPNLLEYHGHALLQPQELPQGKSSSSSNISNASASAIAATTSKDTCSGAQASAGVHCSSKLESLCLGGSNANAAAGPDTVGDTDPPYAPPAVPQLPARRVELDSPVTAAAAPAAPRSAAAAATAAPSISTSHTSPAVAAAAAISAAVNVARAAPRCACSGRAVVSSLAVNRVQCTYTTPVYASEGGGVQDLDRRLWPPRGSPLSPRTASQDDAVAVAGAGAAAADRKNEDAAAAGGRSREEDVQEDGEAVSGVEGEGAGAGAGRGGGGGEGLDGQAYRRRAFNSVHVGELWFDDGGGGGGGGTEGDGLAVFNGVTTTTKRPGHAECGDGGTNNNKRDTTTQHHQHNTVVTVLLPVRNGGDHLLDAVESVVSCKREMPPGWGVDLLIVDDGSDDGAVERAVSAVTDAGNGNTAAVTPGCGRGELGGVPEHTGDDAGRITGDGRAAADVHGEGGQRGERDNTEASEECGVQRSDDAITADGGGGGSGGATFAAGSVVAGRGGGSGGGPWTPSSERGRSRSGVAVRVLRHDRTLGLAESLNEGLREARSDLVARMDADDVCMPGRLRQQVLVVSIQSMHPPTMNSPLVTT